MFARGWVPHLSKKPISAQGVLPFQDLVSSIRNFKIPETQRQLRQFLRMITFYHCFILSAADLLIPLTSLRNKKISQSITVLWTDIACQTFHDAKSVLANAALLLPFALMLTHPIFQMVESCRNARRGFEYLLPSFPRSFSRLRHGIVPSVVSFLIFLLPSVTFSVFLRDILFTF